MAVPITTKPRYVVGVMTGTSLDAIDVAIIRMTSDVTLGHVTESIALAHFYSKALDDALADVLLELQIRSDDELHRAALVANSLADAISCAILEAIRTHGLKAADILAAGVHGQTVRHQPQLGYTIQLNAPARIAEITGITVVSDFRSRDIAAGGQGAPLVPAFHQALFQHDPSIRAVVNIGGIANITRLDDPLVGYDTGPGNMLMNHWARQHLGQRFDANGAWAASGNANSSLLDVMLADPFFSATPPKSTGRDLFDAKWLESFLQRSDIAGIAAADVQATLAELTARSIAQELSKTPHSSAHHAQGREKILVCGGGVHNAHLMARLAAACQHLARDRFQILPTTAAGWDPQVIEAAAFAWLAARTMDGLTGNCPSVTGAVGRRILGAITPA
jgi:anhydro-N-acetylmuramic acid kinase